MSGSIACLLGPWLVSLAAVLLTLPCVLSEGTAVEEIHLTRRSPCGRLGMLSLLLDLPADELAEQIAEDPAEAAKLFAYLNNKAISVFERTFTGKGQSVGDTEQ